jgi:hypothetical protein
MANGVQEFLDDLIASIENFRAKVERLIADFLTGILEFLEESYKWVAEVTRRVADYLERFFTAAGKLTIALLKLSAFYIPSFLLIFIAIVDESFFWLFLAICWFALITLIGLTYRKNR